MWLKWLEGVDVQEQAELRAQLARNAAMLDALTHAAAHGTETLTVRHLAGHSAAGRLAAA
jgi:hypothetical protein